jgi:hypothetical protein
VKRITGGGAASVQAPLTIPFAPTEGIATEEEVMKLRSIVATATAGALAAILAVTPATARNKTQQPGWTGDTILVPPHGVPPGTCWTDEGYGRWSTCDQGA